jgi:hypothetical protein
VARAALAELGYHASSAGARSGNRREQQPSGC